MRRKSFIAVLFLFLLFVLAFASLAWADAALYRGANTIGSVPTINTQSGTLVSLNDVARIFGYSSSGSEEELILSKGSDRIRIIANSAAAWHGLAIVPLYSTPVKQSGKFWIDTSSAVSLFQNSAGSGQNNRLRFAVNNSSTYQPVAMLDDASRRDIEFGKFEEPKPVQLPQIPVPSVRPAARPSRPVNTAQVPASPARLPEVPAPEPIEFQSQEVMTAQTQAQTQSQTPVIAQAPKSAPAVKKSSSKKAQPKFQTFRPDESSKEKTGSYDGSIKLIRWNEHEGKVRKIRAVVEADEGSDPQVLMINGAIHALFASGSETIDGLTSPFANINSDIRNVKGGLDLVFVPNGITKVEKLVLDNPRRIVFDFFFPDEVQFVKTNAPSQQPKTVYAPPKIPEMPPVAQTPRKQSPAVKTPPSTITIPMTPAPKTQTQRGTPVIDIQNGEPIVIRQNNTPAPRIPRRASGGGRKTIVVDPGHGGKDPGAAANGVTEKNINLAVGLELAKALTARGYNVVMTRQTDVYLKLQERTDIANNVNADLFVSVHINALPNKKSATGFEIYIMALPSDKDAMNLAKIENREYVEGKGFDIANVDRKTEMLLRILGDMQQNNKISESTDFAGALLNAGKRNGLPMKRIAQAPFFVLRGAGMPAVLLELGFVTNPSEARLLSQPAYQQKIANAMTEGIMNYLR
ncbi:MAG: N-acetylmuramoyl-L-alanine amidase [Synergistaceae bacterium]|nr:N-acetylmuramoyl-L-alanine amidase [Synergistaceae bacterium]